MNEKVITVPLAQAKYINNVLTTEPKSEADCMGEDNTIVYTARFDDCMEMDIKVCGVQFREGENNLPWTEAVLFRYGSEVACTEPAEDYFGLWEIEYEGVKYSVLVKPDDVMFE